MKRSAGHRVPTSSLVPLTAGIVFCETARRARTGSVGDLEARVFRRCNGAPNSAHLPVWAVMQSGSLATVFVAGGVLARSGRVRAAAAAVVAGTAAWGAVKLVKPIVGRGRPSHVLDDVDVRGHAQTGLGYPSGHVAVAATLGAIVAPVTTPVGWATSIAVGGVVGGTRMYVGAHLPLDVVGGIAIGVLFGRAANEVMDRWP